MDNVFKNKIVSELKELDKLFEEYKLPIEFAKQEEPDLYIKTILGSVLQNFYTGIENIFEIIAKSVDYHVPSGNHSHVDLLEQMSTNTENRKAVIGDNLSLRLSEYLAFRHVARHLYSFKYDWDEMKSLIEECKNTYEDFKKSINIFLEEDKIYSNNVNNNIIESQLEKLISDTKKTLYKSVDWSLSKEKLKFIIPKQIKKISEEFSCNNEKDVDKFLKYLAPDDDYTEAYLHGTENKNQVFKYFISNYISSQLNIDNYINFNKLVYYEQNNDKIIFEENENQSINQDLENQIEKDKFILSDLYDEVKFKGYFEKCYKTEDNFSLELIKDDIKNGLITEFKRKGNTFLLYDDENTKVAINTSNNNIIKGNKLRDLIKDAPVE